MAGRIGVGSVMRYLVSLGWFTISGIISEDLQISPRTFNGEREVEGKLEKGRRKEGNRSYKFGSRVSAVHPSRTNEKLGDKMHNRLKLDPKWKVENSYTAFNDLNSPIQS